MAATSTPVVAGGAASLPESMPANAKRLVTAYRSVIAFASLLQIPRSTCQVTFPTQEPGEFDRAKAFVWSRSSRAAGPDNRSPTVMVKDV